MASEQAKKPKKEKMPADTKPDGYYWTAYAHYGIHEEMLKDEVRTGSYRRAIVENAHLFRGKTVLDIGCGSGVLSMFAAQAGAKQVFGIECSSIVEQAREIVRLNGFADIITLIEGKVEEVTLPVEKVDIIVSEWMGYFLLYEGMLETVLYARDKWLAPGGILMPDKATLSLCAIEDEEYKRDKFDWWNNVYGFDMSCVGKIALAEPLVDIAEARSVVSDSAVVLRLDLATCKKEDLAFSSSWRLVAQRVDRVHAILAYFDIYFSHGHDPVYFSTGPMSPYTHWKQTVFYIDDVLCVQRGEEITGTISVKPNKRNHRDMDIVLSYKFSGKTMSASNSRKYYLR